MPGPRYALEDRVADGPGWALWCGADLVLRRSVGVLMVEPDHPGRDAIAVAAVRASGIRDPGAVHIYDVADTDNGGLRVVREWVDARTLVDRLSQGPLEPAESCRIAAAVGRVLGEAHRTGIAHGHLVPNDVMISDDGRVRVIGIALSAALAGEPIDADPERRSLDARACAAVAYAAVTGRWPGAQEQHALPDAPTTAGHPVRARQVRAGVPAVLDTTLGRLLENATDADDTAEELEDLQARLRENHRAAPVGALSGLLGPAEGSAPIEAPGPRNPLISRTLAVGASLAVLVAAVLVASVLLNDDRGQAATGGSSTPPASTGSTTKAGSSTASPSGSTSAGTPVGPVVIHGVKDFDPEGDGSEEPTLVDLAVDGDLSTYWHTLRYNQADLAPKHGVGLVLDLGSAQDVGAVRVDLVGTGTDLEVRASLTRGAKPSDYALVGQVKNAGQLVTVTAKSPVHTRYILLWLTKLPPTAGGFRGGIAEVTVLRA